MPRTIFEPLSQEVIDISHLAPFEMPVEIKVSDEKEVINIRAHFTEHCYTRSKRNSDPEEAVLFAERKRHDVFDERVFCKERWKFSRSLPNIFKQLHFKGCLLGGHQEIFYRQENSSTKNPHEGWYICARINYSSKHKNITVSVRSIHYRTNRPADIRHHSLTRFNILLSRFVRSLRERGISI